MTAPINLNRARKARAKSAAVAEAAENRRRFGRTKAEREAEAQASERADRAFEGHRLEPGRPTPPGRAGEEEGG